MIVRRSLKKRICFRGSGVHCHILFVVSEIVEVAAQEETNKFMK